MINNVHFSLINMLGTTELIQKQKVRNNNAKRIKKCFIDFKFFFTDIIDYNVHLCPLRLRWGQFIFNAHVQIGFMFHVILGFMFHLILCLIYLCLTLRQYAYNMVYLKTDQQNPNSKVWRFECNRCLQTYSYSLHYFLEST